MEEPLKSATKVVQTNNHNINLEQVLIVAVPAGADAGIQPHPGASVAI